MDAGVRRQVLEVYDAVDAAVRAAGPKCDASGRCCRFVEYGHTLFLSHFEAELLLESAPAYEQPVGRDRCPFQVHNLCTARDNRPLGCRIYFCDPTYEATGSQITEDALARLKRIADAADTGWRYAPLHVFLNEFSQPRADAADTMSPPATGRVPLPLVSDEPRPPDRSSTMPRAIAAVFLTLALTLTLSAADWPQFLGPNRDNTSAEKVAAWKGELKPAWKQPVGDAHSSPVVVGGVVYAFYQPRGQNADALAAFDGPTGKLLWEKSYDREKFDPPFGAGPRGTPAIADGKVYTLGGTGVLACWAQRTGEILWKVDTLKEFKAPNLTFGVSASPLVSGGKVFLNVGGKGAGLVAFDAATGKTAWKAGDDAASYASPIAIEAGGAKQIVFLTASGLVGVNPDTGAEYWRQPFKDVLQESATTPLFAGGTLFGSSVTLGSIALKFEPKDDKPAVAQVWKSAQLNCYFSTPVLAGKDRLYMLTGKLSINPTITLRCVDPATGKVRWSKPDVGKYHAALIRTADEKLLMLDDTGYLTLFADDVAEFKQLAKSKVCGPTWAHPALVDGHVFLRDEKELICVPLGG